MKRDNRGFTLVELLVVIGIIGILIIALVPIVRGVQVRAKEQVVKVNCANIETGLANYAQNHNGLYPGVALDVMAPFSDHALGDPGLYSGSPGDNGVLGIAAGELANGILGGFGYYNASTASMFQQLKAVKDTELAGNEDTARYFDALMAADALQEYPSNPFVTSAGAGAGVNQGERARMRNIFWFSLNLAGGFDPNSIGDGFDGGPYSTGLYTNSTGDGGPWSADTFFDPTRGWLEQVVAITTFTPQGFSDACLFGVDEGDYFAPGDFAYVPVLTTSAYSFGDAAPTLENEFFKYGTAVSGYMLFGYGHQDHEAREFEDEQREFVATGLPGYGAPGIDTLYENVALQCFEGAIYFNKSF
jgi:prepilin-type N-terminal cleavage/methylation domain-containing protein